MFFRIKENKKIYLIIKNRKFGIFKVSFNCFFKVILKNNYTNIENKKK